MKGFQGGMQNFIKQANQMQARLGKLQEELNAKIFEATTGGGAVKVKVNGKHDVVALTISEDVMKSGDTEMLQDLVMTAINDGIAQARKTAEEETSKLTGGMSIPGMF